MKKIHRSVVRNNAYSRSGISIRERHNERKNECYANEDITLERSHLNVYFKKCESTYIEYFDKLIEDKIISTRGLQADASIIDEFVFDVNTEYFETHGGYDYAKEFFADAYQMAIKEAGDKRYIISAVMHADERNRELSEKLGRDVFHYHLHVVYVPVVEKEVKWTKRCKDKSLVGKTKEIIHQVSHSKKWGFQKATDGNGEEIKTSSGKTKLIVPYSELQDRFFEYMKNLGYVDFERGVKGSTAEHLSVEEFKLQQEQKRIEEIDKDIVDKNRMLISLNSQVDDATKVQQYITNIDEMGKRKLGGKVEYTKEENEKLKNLARAGIAAEHTLHEQRKEIRFLKSKLKEWEKAYRELHDYVKDFLYVTKLAPERIKNFISDIIKEFTDRRVSNKNKNIEQYKER